jgi:hypothetical protein
VVGVPVVGFAHVLDLEDVPWNGPFYARLGFAKIPDPDWMAPLLAAEARIGLPQAGRRVAMQRLLH